MKGITAAMVMAGVAVAASGCATTDKTANMTKDQRAAHYTLQRQQHADQMGYNSLDNRRNVSDNVRALNEPAARQSANKPTSNPTNPN